MMNETHGFLLSYWKEVRRSLNVGTMKLVREDILARTLADKLEELTEHKIDLVSRRAIKPLVWKQIERELIDV